MAPKYTVTYFDSPGRAEPTRLALAAAGVDFTDTRVNSEEWAKLKPSVKLGQLPILDVEVGGKTTRICQSGAMIRFVAREHGLYGKNNIESAEVDVVIETLEDFFKELIKVFVEKDEKKKEEIKAELGKTAVPKYVKVFEDIKGDKDYMVGSKLTIADIAVVSVFTNMPGMFGEAAFQSFADNKNMQAHAKRVCENPGIKKWLASRPAPKK